MGTYLYNNHYSIEIIKRKYNDSYNVKNEPINIDGAYNTFGQNHIYFDGYVNIMNMEINTAFVYGDTMIAYDRGTNDRKSNKEYVILQRSYFKNEFQLKSVFYTKDNST